MERCPHCRARLKGRRVCSRCESDLSLVLAIEERAEILSRRAFKSLASGDIEAATREAEAAKQFHDTDFHRVLAGFTRRLSQMPIHGE